VFNSVESIELFRAATIVYTQEYL